MGGECRGRLALLWIPLLTLAISGCGAKISPKNIVPTGVTVTRQHAEAVSLTVSGGRETDPSGLPQVSDQAFAEAITTAIQNSHAFDRVVPAPEGTYLLLVNIASLQQPFFGGAFTVKMEVGWQLQKAATREIVWQKGITSSKTVTVGEAFMGPTRVRLATEGAARENVRLGIEALSQLDL